MDCKSALGETSGDMEQAVDLLRKKGLAKADKKAGRVAADGLVGQLRDGWGVVQAVVADVAQLPDDQRAALVLSELADLSHAQIGDVIGVRAEKVKALVHQARSTLIAERDAR